MNAIFIQSMLDDDVVDVQGAKAAAGTPLDAFPAKITWDPSGYPPPTPEQLAHAANQLWTFVPSPVKGSFFIESQLDSNLVMDVKGAKAAPGTPIQVYTKKPTSNPEEIDEAKNQLWYWIEVDPPHNNGLGGDPGYMIESLLDADLVVDITGASTNAGTLLQVYTKKPTGTADEFESAANQLWTQVPTYYGVPK
jgi:hypothetical protein